MAKAFSPAVMTANDLLDGDTVWWTGSDWSRDIAKATVAQTAEARQNLDTSAASAIHDAVVVGPYLVDVSIKNGAPYPTVRREAIRADREPTFAYADQTRLEKAA